MFAEDFVFNKRRLSDFGLMIGNIDGENNSTSGGEIEYVSVKTPNRDSFDYLGMQFNSPIEFNFSIIKNPCKVIDNQYFSQYEESLIAEWLLSPRDGYKWLQFDQEGFEDIYYAVKFQMTPKKINGKTYGYDLVATSNCGYGWTREKKQTIEISKNNKGIIEIRSDIKSYVYPKINITNATGNFYISNNTDSEQCITTNMQTAFKNVSTGTVLNLDCDSEIIKGITLPTDFNYYYLRLLDGKNEFITNSDTPFVMEFKYREPRRVIV